MEDQTSQTSTGAGSTTQNKSLMSLGLIIVFGIFATTLPQPQVLGRLPLQHLLKSDLHVSPDQMAFFFLACGLAWYLKPFAGILTDAFPLCKTRRRHYILFSTLATVGCWVALGFLPHTYNALLWGCIVTNLFMVITSTVVGAYLVEAGQTMAATGRLTALRQLVSNICSLISGPFGGMLATGAFAVAAGVNAGIVFSFFPIAYFFLREKPQHIDSFSRLTNAKGQLKTIFRSRNLWFALLFISLFYFSPGFGTIMYYRQTDELHFKQTFIGFLGSCSGGAGMVAALLYGVLIRRLNLRTMIAVGVATAAAGTLLYLFYSSRVNAILIESQNGFFFTLAEISLLDLAAHATPAGCEGLGYSLMLSARNLAIFGADWLGAKSAKVYHLEFNTMVFINAGTTALVLVLLPFLPRLLLNSSDRKAA